MPPSSVSLAVVVQHHPARARLLPDLLARIGNAEVVTDPEPDGPRAPIRTYLACLRAMPEWATHICVTQDDVRPGPDFRRRAERAVAEKPEDVLALFLGGAPARSARLAQRAHRDGERWVRMFERDWTPTVCTVWHREHVDGLLRFVEERPKLVGTGDDNLTGAYTRENRITVWATVPSLVEHPDVEPSLIGRKASAGRNRYRVAAVPPVD